MKNILNKFLNDNIQILPANIPVTLITVSEEYFVVMEFNGTEHYFPYSSITGITILPPPEKLWEMTKENKSRKKFRPLLMQYVLIYIDNFDNTTSEEILSRYLE